MAGNRRMVSEIDLELMEVMGEIRKREAQNSLRDGPEGPSGEPLRRVPPLGRRARSLLPVLVLLALSALLLYVAYLAGFFGTTRGQGGLWRDAYWNASDLLDEAIGLRNEWESTAVAYLSDLESCGSELEALKSDLRESEDRHWETRVRLNQTLLEVQSLELELDRTEQERSSFEILYMEGKERIELLEAEHASMVEELAKLKAELGQAAVDKSKLEASLEEATQKAVKLQVALLLLELKLWGAEEEAEGWLERFHKLELEYRDLLCELRMCRNETEDWQQICREREGQIARITEELESCMANQREIRIALDEALDDNARLRRLYESARSRLGALMSERDRLMRAYRELNSTCSLLVEEKERWRLRYVDLTLVLVELESERDHWQWLYEQQHSQLVQCAMDVQYWKGQYDYVQSQLSIALVQLGILQNQLSECQYGSQQCEQLYQTCQAQLQEALSQVQHWRKLYEDLACISLSIELGNATVVERQCGKPSVVSVDVRVCASTTETPILLFLESWAEPTDCTWGYGSLLEDISTWTGNCKTFRVTLDFGKGAGPYKIMARGCLRPIQGCDEEELVGPG